MTCRSEPVASEGHGCPTACVVARHEHGTALMRFSARFMGPPGLPVMGPPGAPGRIRQRRYAQQRTPSEPRLGWKFTQERIDDGIEYLKAPLRCVPCSPRTLTGTATMASSSGLSRTSRHSGGTSSCVPRFRIGDFWSQLRIRESQRGSSIDEHPREYPEGSRATWNGLGSAVNHAVTGPTVEMDAFMSRVARLTHRPYMGNTRRRQSPPWPIERGICPPPPVNLVYSARNRFSARAEPGLPGTSPSQATGSGPARRTCCATRCTVASRQRRAP